MQVAPQCVQGRGREGAPNQNSKSSLHNERPLPFHGVFRIRLVSLRMDRERTSKAMDVPRALMISVRGAAR